jgi:hypothetical protein
MIEPELGGDRERLTSSKSLGGGQENFFFHADMAEKPGSELIIRCLIDVTGMSHSLLKQLLKPLMVFHKKVCDRSGFFALSWLHPLPPTMFSSEQLHRGHDTQQSLPSIFIVAGLLPKQNAGC